MDIRQNHLWVSESGHAHVSVYVRMRLVCYLKQQRRSSTVNTHTKNTLKVNCSLKTGLRVFRWTFVSNFFFLSGSRKPSHRDQECPPCPKAGSSAAWMIPTRSWNEGRRWPTLALVNMLEKDWVCSQGCTLWLLFSSLFDKLLFS